MAKRLFPLALALILCLVLAAPAFAADGDFVIENGVLTEYNGPGGNVTIPDGVTGIGNEAFYDCGSLTGVTIPDTVTSIGDDAFTHCYSLTGVTIPGSVTSIGHNAFWRCYSLTAIEVDKGNRNYCSVDGVLFTRDMKTLVAYPGGKRGAYSVPDGVASIGGYTFARTRLTDVNIPDSVTSIGNYAFLECTSLTSAVIPYGVISIGDYAFQDCSNLISVTVPSSVTSILGRHSLTAYA